jgi:hypothetical protein
MTSYSEVVDKDGQSKTQTDRNAMAYNTLSQLTSYTDIITNLEGATDLKTTVKFGNNNGTITPASYDNYGRLSDYFEYKHETGLNLDVTTTTHRLGLGAACLATAR